MSGMLEHLHVLLAEARAELAKLFAHGDTDVQAVARDAAAKLDAARDTIADELPALEHETEADAEKVAADAETAAKTAATDAEHEAAPVAAEAVKDAEAVGGEAAADIAKDA